jgi:hypothetical protein
LIDGKKFLGIGLKQGMAVSLFVIIFIVLFKVVLNKYPVKGLTEIINVV